MPNYSEIQDTAPMLFANQVIERHRAVISMQCIHESVGKMFHRSLRLKISIRFFFQSYYNKPVPKANNIKPLRMNHICTEKHVLYVDEGLHGMKIG
jgi:hypothetical protein